MPRRDFELSEFVPYLLNQAAETQSDRFSRIYRDRYGMLRTEWRVLYHLGRYGALSAKEISERAKIHKTKISRAVRALEEKRFLTRRISDTDRRVETLELRPPGLEAFAFLSRAAADHDRELRQMLGPEAAAQLKETLARLAG